MSLNRVQNKILSVTIVVDSWMVWVGLWKPSLKPGIRNRAYQIGVQARWQEHHFLHLEKHGVDELCVGIAPEPNVARVLADSKLNVRRRKT
jgi:hypothetical protein